METRGLKSTRVALMVSRPWLGNAFSVERVTAVKRWLALTILVLGMLLALCPTRDAMAQHVFYRPAIPPYTVWETDEGGAFVRLSTPLIKPIDVIHRYNGGNSSKASVFDYVLWIDTDGKGFIKTEHGNRIPWCGVCEVGIDSAQRFVLGKLGQVMVLGHFQPGVWELKAIDPFVSMDQKLLPPAGFFTPIDAISNPKGGYYVLWVNDNEFVGYRAIVTDENGEQPGEVINCGAGIPFCKAYRLLLVSMGGVDEVQVLYTKSDGKSYLRSVYGRIDRSVPYQNIKEAVDVMLRPTGYYILGRRWPVVPDSLYDVYDESGNLYSGVVGFPNVGGLIRYQEAITIDPIVKLDWYKGNSVPPLSPAEPFAPSGYFFIQAYFRNRSAAPMICNPFFELAEPLSPSVRWLETDAFPGGGALPIQGLDGALSDHIPFTLGSDGALFTLSLGLQDRQRFRFFVHMKGYFPISTESGC